MADSGRRSFLTAALFVKACPLDLETIAVESDETPFFEHYHQLSLPVSALVDPPKDGILLSTSAVDQGSYDIEGFERFIRSSGLDRDKLKSHSHDILISQADLKRIAGGEKNVEIRVISKAGNYVHNFKITASASALAKVRKGN
jgi:hypothetical protein